MSNVRDLLKQLDFSGHEVAMMNTTFADRLYARWLLDDAPAFLLDEVWSTMTKGQVAAVVQAMLRESKAQSV